EVELIGVPVLRVPRPHRPRRLLALERSLDLGTIGPGIDVQPGVVVGDHGCGAVVALPRCIPVPAEPVSPDGFPSQFYEPGSIGSTGPGDRALQGSNSLG